MAIELSEKTMEKISSQDRISVTFIKDYQNYNRGERAVWPKGTALFLIREGIADYHDEKVRNDSTFSQLMAVPEGNPINRLCDLLEKLLPALLANPQQPNPSPNMVRK